MGVRGSASTTKSNRNTRKSGVRPVTEPIPVTLAFALEPRFMFDAAGAATAADHADQQAAEQAANAAAAPAGDGGDSSHAQVHAVALDQALADAAPAVVSPSADTATAVAQAAMVAPPDGPAYRTLAPIDPDLNNGRREVAFVSTSVADWQTLAAGVKPGVEVVVLDGSKDGLSQMADWAREHTGYDAMHVLGHGAEGKIWLGSLTLDGAATAARSADLAIVGAALTADGDLMLYGCDVATGKGQAFIEAVATATGAEVAASSDPTGALAKGGDWTLEASAGTGDGITTAALSIDRYANLLTVVDFDTTLTPTISGATFSFDDTDPNSPPYDYGGGYYVFQNADADGIDLTITLTAGYTFDITSFDYFTSNATAPTVTVTVTYANNTTATATFPTVDNAVTSVSSFVFDNGATAIDDVKSVNFTASQGSGNIDLGFKNFSITDVRAPAANNTPVITSLGGDTVTWAGVGNTVVLDSGGNATISDMETGALNSGNGDWSNGPDADATLTVRRAIGGSVSPLTSDMFGFNTAGANFTATSSELQSGGQTFATYTSAGGVLTITFTSGAATATTALVQEVAQRVTYRNDTPTGDTTIRFTLADGAGGTTNADVTVKSDTIYVTSTTDTATIDVTNGVSFSEAVAIAAADTTGSQTIVLSNAFSGSFNLAAALTLTESLTINADAANGVTIAARSITLDPGVLLTITNTTGGLAAISSQITGTGSITKAGAGTLTLDNAGNSYSGATQIAAGTLTSAGGGGIGDSSAVTVDAGATLSLGNGDTVGSLAGAGTVDLGANTLAAGGANTSTSFSGVIGGTGGLTKQGSGTLTLTGANSFTGDLTIGAGGVTLNHASGTALADTAGVKIDGGTLTLSSAAETIGTLSGTGGTLALGANALSVTQGTNQTLSAAITGGGSLAKAGSGTLTLGSTSNSSGWSGGLSITGGAVSIGSDSRVTSGTITIDGGTLQLNSFAGGALDNTIVLGSSNGTLQVTNGDATIAGTITGTGNLTKSGATKLTLSGTNNYSGSTTLNGAGGNIISIASSSNIGTGAITINDSALLQVTTGGTLANAITLSGTAGLQIDGATSLDGLISGTSSDTLAKSGSATLTLTNTSNSGQEWATSLTAGTLSIGAATNIGSGGITLDGATLENTGSGVTLANAITLAASGTISTADALTLSGAVAGSGTLIKSGGGTLTLGSTSNGSATWLTQVSAGTLSIGAASNLGTGAIQLAGGTLESTGSSVGLSQNIVFSSGSTVTVGNGNALTLSGILSGTGALTKSDAGTLTLSGTNTRSGATTVGGGTLLVTGTLNGVGAAGVSVSSGATLGGTGTVNSSAVFAAGATLAPGVAGTNNGVGTLIINGDLLMSSTSTLAIDIAGAGSYDSITVNGAVQVPGVLLSLSGSHTVSKSAGGQGFVIIDNDGSDLVTGTFAGLSEGGTVAFNSVNLTGSYAGGTNSNDVTLTGPVNQAPVLGGSFTTAGTVNDNATTSPFSGVTITDADDNSGTFTVTITYTAANGTLSSGTPSALTGTAGNYTLTASSPGELQTLLEGLVFTPTSNQVTPGSTVATSFTLTPSDSITVGSSNATTQVTATAVNDAPTVTAPVNGVVSTFDAANASVATVSATDPDTGFHTSWTFSIQSVTFGGSPADNTNGTLFDFGTTGSPSTATAVASATLRAVTPSTMAVGAYVVTVRATDALGGFHDQAITVTVSNDLIVTSLDIDGNAPSGTYAVDAADGTTPGVDLREALYYANNASGNITIRFASTLAGTITLPMSLTVRDGVSFAMDSDTDNRAITIDSSSFALGGSFGISVSTGDTLTLNSAVTGSATAALTKSGNGTLRLGGLNTYTGGTTLSAGTLSIGSVSGLGGGTLGLNGGTLEVTDTSGAFDFSGAVTIAAASTVRFAEDAKATFSGALSGSGDLTVTGVDDANGGREMLTVSNGSNATGWSGAVTLSTGAEFIVQSVGALTTGTVTLNGGTTLALLTAQTLNNSIVVAGDALVASDNGATTLTGAVSGSGTLSLQVTNGTLELAGQNTHTGSVVVSVGTVIVSGGSAIGDNATVTLDQTSSLQVRGNETIGTLNLGGNGGGANKLVDLGTGYTLSLGSGSFAGVISGAGALTKTGGGTLSLSGANTYTGATTVSGGTLSVSGSGTAGTGSAVTVASGATLDSSAVTSSLAIGSLEGAGTVVLGAKSLTVGSNNTSTVFSGAIAGSGALTKTGSGTMTLSGSNSGSYSGETAVSSGTLSVGSDDNLGSGTITLNGGTLSITGTTANIDNAVQVGVNGATIQVGTGASATLSGGFTGPASLTKTGAGTLTLTSGAISHSGATTVSEGTLVLGASALIDSSPTVTVSSGATLAGSGTIANALVVSAGAALAPGGVGTVGMLTVNGGLTLNGTLKLDLGSPVSGTATAGTDYDQVKVGGAVTLGATSAFDATYTATRSNNSFTVIDQTGGGTIGGTIGGTVAEGGTLTSNSRQYKVSYLGGTGNDLTLRDNAPPTITSVAPTTVNEDGAYSYSVVATDADGDPLTLTATTLPAWMSFVNGVLSGTPAQNDIGSHTVVLRVDDGKSGVATQTFTITVNAVNDAPAITSSPPTSVNENGTYVYTMAATDEEGEAITYTATTLPSWLTFSNGVLSGTPGAGSAGSHTVTLTATDASGAVTSQTFTITVNGAPVSAPSTPTAVTVNQGSPYSYTPSFSDPEGQPVTITAATLPSWMSFSNGVLSGTPGAGDRGSHTVTLTATDASGATTTRSFTVVVNGAPVAAAGSPPPTTATQGAGYSYTPSFTDPEGQTVTVTATTLPSWLTFANGVLSGTPGAGNVGIHTVTLAATDASGAVTTQTFAITVAASVNAAPTFTSSTQATLATAGQAYSFTITTSDATNDTLTITANGLPSWLTVTDNGNGTATLTGTPGSGDVGSVTITLTVTDADGASSTQTLSVAVSSGTALNITQTSTNSSATPAPGTAGTGPGTGSPANGSTVAVSAISAAPGGNGLGGASGSYLLFGNVEGNASSSTGLQQTQGLTTTATSGDASASADGSTLVRNAARGDSAATSSFYGAGTVISANLFGAQGGSGNSFGSGVGRSLGNGLGGGLGMDGLGLGGFGIGAFGRPPFGTGSGVGSGTGPDGTSGTGIRNSAPPNGGASPAAPTGTTGGTPPGQGAPRGGPQGQPARPGGNAAPAERTPDAAPSDTPPGDSAALPADGALFGLFDAGFGAEEAAAPHTGFTARLAGIADSFNARSSRLDAALSMLDQAA